MENNQRTLVVIVAYNFMKWADKCLGSVALQDAPCDVMVVDNGSTDGTAAHIRQHHPQVMLVENHRNLGFGRANNVGMLYALDHGYSGVLLLNQDAWLDPGVLRQLLEVSRRHPDYGIISPVHLTGSHDNIDHGFGEYTEIETMDQQPDIELEEASFINAAIWYVTADAMRRVGLFSPIFHLYGEDVDLVNRLFYYKLHLGFVPHVYACHDREQRQNTPESLLRGERTWHLAEYCNIHYKFPWALANGVLAIFKKSWRKLRYSSSAEGRVYLRMGFGLLKRTPAVLLTRWQSRHVKLSNYAADYRKLNLK